MGKVTNLGGYLTVMLKNQVADYISDYKSHVAEFSPNDNVADYSTEDLILSHDFEEKLTIALAKLAPRCKQAFELSRFEQLTNKEIAQQMNISVKGVEALMGRSLKFLRMELSEFLPSSKIVKNHPVLFFLRIANKFFRH